MKALFNRRLTLINADAWKALFVMICVHLCSSAVTLQAATQVYSTVTVTNGAAMTNGMQFTVNGDIRIAVTNITNAARSFLITNNNERLATNLYTHVLSYGFTNTTLQWVSSNSIRLIGGTNYALAVSQFGNWCSISNYTSVVYSAIGYTTPYRTTDSEAFRIWQQNHILTNLQYATERLNAAWTAFASFVNNQNTNGQNVTNLIIRSTDGTLLFNPITRTFGNVTFYSVTITNGQLTMSGTQTVSGLVFNSGGSLYLFTPNAGSNSVVTLGMFTNFFPGLFHSNTPSIFSTTGNRSSINDRVNINGDTAAGGGRFHFVEAAPPDSDVENAVFTSTNTVDELLETWNVLPPGGAGGGQNAYTIMRFLDMAFQDQFAAEFGANDYPRVYIRTNAPIYEPQLVSPTLVGVQTNTGAMINPADYDATLVAGQNIVSRTAANSVVFNTTGGAASIDNITNAMGDGDWFWARNNTGYPLNIVHFSGYHSAGRIIVPGSLAPNDTITVPIDGSMLFEYEGSSGLWYLRFPARAIVLMIGTNAVPITSNIFHLNFATGAGAFIQPHVVTNAAGMATISLNLTNTITNRLAGLEASSNTFTLTNLVWHTTNALNVASLDPHAEAHYPVSAPGVRTNNWCEVRRPYNVLSNLVEVIAVSLSNDWVNLIARNLGTNAVDLPAADYRIKVEQFQ